MLDNPADDARLDHVVSTLNTLRLLDPGAMNGLFSRRVQVNDAFADAGLAVVSPEGVDPALTGSFTVSVVGLLNGLFGFDRRRIASIHDESGYLVGFMKRDIPPKDN